MQVCGPRLNPVLVPMLVLVSVCVCLGLQVLRLGAPVTSLSLSPSLDLLATTHTNRRGVYLWANQVCLHTCSWATSCMCTGVIVSAYGQMHTLP